MLRNVVNGLRNSCDTADTKSACRRATANSRETAFTTAYEPVKTRMITSERPISNNACLPCGSAVGERGTAVSRQCVLANDKTL